MWHMSFLCACWDIPYKLFISLTKHEVEIDTNWLISHDNFNTDLLLPSISCLFITRIIHLAVTIQVSMLYYSDSF